jgi:integrase
MALTDTAIKSFRAGPKPRKHSDGGGLFLLVSENGSKLWRLSYRFDRKQKTIALGAYPAVSLSDARRKRDDVKITLARGIDPSHQIKMEKIARQVSSAATFRAVADEYLDKDIREGKAAVTLKKKKWLLGQIMPDLGSRPVSEITAAEILISLRRIEAKGNYETARRVRSTIGQIFRYAIATARAENDPTFGLKGALTSPVVTHRAAVTDWPAFGGLVRAVWGYEGMPQTRIGLQLMALLYPRPGELRRAEWFEFDLEKATWTIPAVRMKMRREHRKPLSIQAVTILKALHQLTGDGRLVFPATTSWSRSMSENTLNGALRRMGFGKDEATSHGFRASASSLLNESGEFSVDAIEAELAHVGSDEVRRAYHRALYWDERVQMAQWWADKIFEIGGMEYE